MQPEAVSYFAKESELSRVIHYETAGNERKQLSRAIILAICALMRQTEPDKNFRDLAAFIALALEGIASTIDELVQAWESAVIG